MISNSTNFEFETRKNKRIQLSVIKWQNAFESMSSRMSASLLSFKATDAIDYVPTVRS
jgi:hypothetical protein